MGLYLNTLKRARVAGDQNQLHFTADAELY